MTSHMTGKTIIVTGAGGGFGALICAKAGAMGAKLVCADIDIASAQNTADQIVAAGGQATAVKTDVASAEDMKILAGHAIEMYGAIDVLVNNAGIMPLAFYADHEAAMPAWHRCIDINFKGILNGIAAVHDQMIAQERGHVVNISSIYGNFPVAGAGVYGATKAAVNFLSESLRVESRGKIKVTTIRPTGVPATKLAESVINAGAAIGIVGQNMEEFATNMAALEQGTASPEKMNPDDPAYIALSPLYIADAVLSAIDQPWGVSVSDITVRATGDPFIL